MSAIETMGETLQRVDSSARRKGTRRLSLTACLDWIESRLERRRSRIALLEMTDQQLQDIGVSRAEAYRESHRSFWS